MSKTSGRTSFRFEIGVVIITTIVLFITITALVYVSASSTSINIPTDSSTVAVLLIALFAICFVALWIATFALHRRHNTHLTRIADDLDTLRLGNGAVSLDAAEIGPPLATAFDTLTLNLAEINRILLRAINEIDSTSGDITQSSNVASTELTECVTRLTDAERSVKSLASEMSNIIIEFDSIVQAEHKTLASAQKGNELVARLIDLLNRLDDSTRLTSQHVAAYVDRSEEINDLVDAIQSTASKTNLLALNAAIEAARAGDAGHGFGIVAEEIRSLADHTTQIADGISAILEQQRAETVDSRLLLEQIADDLGGSIAHANDSQRLLGDVERNVTGTLERVKRNEEAARDQLTATNAIVGNLTSIARAIEHEVEQSQQSTKHADNLRAVSERLGRLAQTSEGNENPSTD